MRRSQISVEFMVVIGMLMLVLAPVWLTLLRSIQEEQNDLRMSQAATALERIVQAADLVYVQGSPASTVVAVYVPPGVLNYSLSNNETVYVMLVAGSTTDVIEPTKTPLVGNLPIVEGSYKLLVKAEDDGVVNITGVA